MTMKPFDLDKIKHQVLKHLIDWQRHKASRNMDALGVPSQSPLSEYAFCAHHWKEHLPALETDVSADPAYYQYAQDFHRRETEALEQAVASVFQELFQQHVIAVAAPYTSHGGTTGYGLGLGGTPTHQYELSRGAAQFADLDMEGFLNVVTIPAGFKDLTPSVADFARKVGPYEKNVFLIMPFGSDLDLQASRTAMEQTLKAKGYRLFRADDSEYEGGLWDNICAYMLGCKYAIALFKNVSSVPYNPNVGVEIGFMMALNKPVLILKDKNLPKLPGDLIHRLYHQVDFANTAEAQKEVGKWIDDLS